MIVGQVRILKLWKMGMFEILFIKFFLLFGLGSWLIIACRNNILDPNTNIILLTNMVVMEDIKNNNLGKGLLPRAWKNGNKVKYILKSIIILQALISIGLLFSAFLFFHSIFKADSYQIATQLANCSLLSFCSLWFTFLCGGLWFGYWIHMNSVQTTHFILLIIGFLSLGLINSL